MRRLPLELKLERDEQIGFCPLIKETCRRDCVFYKYYSEEYRECVLKASIERIGGGNEGWE